MITDKMVEAAAYVLSGSRYCVIDDQVKDDLWDEFKAHVRAALEAADRAAWEPIESAPKSGRDIIAAQGGAGIPFISSWGICRPQDDGYRAFGGVHCWRAYDQIKAAPSPTHWRHLPSPPEDK